IENYICTYIINPYNYIIINNIKISSNHAEIRLKENGFSITDLGSIHGTYVNGERLDFNTPRLLNQGNSITIGDIVFTYDIEETPQIEETIPILHKHEQ